MNNEFIKLNQTSRENLLMETAMMITGIFKDMLYDQQFNPEKVLYDNSIERLEKFCDWSREFEIIYYGSKEYKDDYLLLIDQWTQKRLKDEYGKE